MSPSVIKSSHLNQDWIGENVYEDYCGFKTPNYIRHEVIYINKESQGPKVEKEAVGGRFHFGDGLGEFYIARGNY